MNRQISSTRLPARCRPAELDKAAVTPTAAPASDIVADEERLAALDGYGILDTPPEDGFDDIVQLAALACDVPVALVSLIDDGRQWFKARIGLALSQTDLGSSVCVHALAEPDLLVIPDLAADPRTRDNPLVTGPPCIRFYAGAPLRAPGGQALGSLCVIDRTPRPDGLTARQAEMLRTLARQVMALMELRRIISGRDSHIARRREAEERLDQAAVRLRISEAHWRGLFERLSEGFLVGEVLRDEAGRRTGATSTSTRPGAGSSASSPQRHRPHRARGRPGHPPEWIDEFVQVVEATERVRADIRRGALLEIGDQLQTLDTTEDMTRLAAAIVGQALDVTRAGFGWIDDDGEHVTVDADWTAGGMPASPGGIASPIKGTSAGSCCSVSR